MYYMHGDFSSLMRVHSENVPSATPYAIITPNIAASLDVNNYVFRGMNIEDLGRGHA